MFAKQQAIFRSRWRALFWASGVLLTAYCAVPSPVEDNRAQRQAAAQNPHSNPWALDPARH